MRYKELKVWQKAHNNALKAIELYKNIDSKKFDNIFKQFISSITSISANIAEGSGGFKDKEFVRFLNIALRSAYEADNWISLIKDSKIIENKGCNKIEIIEAQNEEIVKMLVKLIQSQTNP
ncbi:MAG: four helix bundle protein [Nitrospirae bacterium]|nr:four helix bundle protein [Nitrospirota bacterium]